MSHPQPRITVAAVVERDNSFLMVEELIDGVRYLNQPAGHLEPAESLVEAAIRETLEETAWHFKPDALTGIYHWQHPTKSLAYIRFAFSGLIHDQDVGRPLDSGIVTTHWMSREVLENADLPLRSPMVLKTVDDYIAGNRYPLTLAATIL